MLTLELSPTRKPVNPICAAPRRLDDPGFRHEPVVPAASHDVRGQVNHARFPMAEALNDLLQAE